MSMPAEQLPATLQLDTLLAGLADAPPVPIVDIAMDSRRLCAGSLFLACPGATHHGLDFREQAIAAGVAAIAFDASTATGAVNGFGVPTVPVQDLTSHLGEIANRFFDFPSARLKVAGVTGTNGKTTVAWMIARCLTRLGRQCGYAGTLGFGIGKIDEGGQMTSPDVIELNRRLAGFCDSGADYAAIEVSSHALDQRRVDGTRFDAVLFTNLSRDHLDYHGDMRAYGNAKAKLFLDYPTRCRIVNLDSEFGGELASRCGDEVITVSTKFDRVANGRPYAFVRSVITRSNGSDVRLQTSWGDAQLFVPLLGEFNIANAVLVLAYLLSAGIDLDDACDALAGIDAPPGRMQRVNAASGPSVYIDYAHTPNALDAALHAVRAHSRGKVWCVFGCGGNRDAGKRPMMGRIAERLADRVVVTDDNPRDEASAHITDGIVSGFNKADAATVIADRKTAIEWAIAHAAPADVILIAGKGHECHQIVAGEQREFSDYAVAAAKLTATEREGRA